MTQFSPKSAVTLLAVAVTLAATSSGAATPATKRNPKSPVQSVDFATQIRPIISAKCFACHGPDEGSRKAKLRLDLREEAIKDRKGVRAIVPGDVNASEVVKRITSTDPDEVMPPPKSGHKLSAQEMELLKRWIAQGANYTPHWAFVKPERPALPRVKQKAWPRNALDFFVLEKLEQNGLKPSLQADRYTLVRRLSLDLTGLPPTPEEVDAFVNDKSRDAYEKLVDRLLGSPAFGERWARVWLDLARYADSAGYGSDPLRLNIWPWRDWVIRALNRNLPFDQFTVEQLAGDLLPDPTEEQLIATAFHRNTMTNTEGGTDDEEFRVAAVKDRIGVTGQVWMGLTVGCAQCHSHKYDPITHREYYQLFAFFNETEDNDQPDEKPTLPLPTQEQKEKLDKLKAEIAKLEEQRKTPSAEFDRELVEWEKQQAQGIEWIVLDPAELRSAGGAALAKLEDQSILASGKSPDTDTYTVRVRTDFTNLTALRLELLPHESLPKQGPGRAEEGRAILNEFALAVRAATNQLPKARFIRVELPGPVRILSLAEVQIFDGRENVAPKGKATQSSTQDEADAARAIDGNTDGDFGASSTTMTKTEDSPWWELDLGADTPLDEIAIWNRSDRGLGTRLSDFKVLALDAQRKTVWEKTVGQPPGPVAFFRVPAEKEAKLVNASADFSDKDYEVRKAIDGDTGRKNGWSIGDQTGKAHAASFEIEGQPVTEPGALLIFTLTQRYGTNHTIGRFRLSATTQPQPVRILPTTLAETLATAPDQRTEKQRDELANYFRDFAPCLADVNRELKRVRKELDDLKPVGLPVMRELTADKRRETRILNKGNFLDPGDKVEPGVPGAFHAWPAAAPTNRLGLAQWLVSPDNPLTARVAVNRLWAQLFGAGIVETEEDFGTQGALPTHRELLDWLAVEFMAPGTLVDGLNRSTVQPARKGDDSTIQRLNDSTGAAWDTKRLLKTIVMSATYQQSSRVTPALLEKDPRNRLYSRAPRRRLDAETVRDQALALAGLLSRKVGGPSVYPYQPDGLWRAAFNGERTWAVSKGEDKYRRGLYTFWRRTVPYPSMATFDAPSRENCTLRRLPTNTPLQAYVTLNDPCFVEAAQALARRLLREGGASAAEKVRFGLRLCLVRPPKDEQVKALVELFERERAAYAAKADEARKLATDPLGPLADGCDAAEAAAWTAVANVLLNLDGVLTRG
jgi:mono/diheme cytochrome c family protein